MAEESHTAAARSEFAEFRSEPVHFTNDPLYIHSGENVSVSLVSEQLTGIKNYITWRKAMEMALGFKLKLGFVRGDFPKPADPYRLALWERCNSAEHTWIVNSVSKEIASTIIHSKDCVHAWSVLQSRFGGSIRPRLYSLRKEINTLTQGEMSVAEYHGRLLHLWSEEEVLQDVEPCDLGMTCKSTVCFERKVTEMKIMQFLMGLNEVHGQIRTQILGMKPMPQIDNVYNMVLEDESDKGIHKPVTEFSALYSSGRSQENGKISQSGFLYRKKSH